MKLLRTFAVILFIAVSFFPSVVFAQPGGGGCNPDAGPCPIDNGVIILIVAALAIAIKKYYNTCKIKSLHTS